MKERKKSRLTTSVLHSDPVYRAWAGMLNRCRNPRVKCYSNYGGRGIKVCERWLTFENFAIDMGPRPSANHSLDRIDTNDDYFPQNCRWATKVEQGRNKRNNVHVTYGSETKPLSQWCDELGLPYKRTHRRLTSGWPLERVFSEGRQQNTRQRALKAEFPDGVTKVYSCSRLAVEDGFSRSCVLAAAKGERGAVHKGVKWSFANE